MVPALPTRLVRVCLWAGVLCLAPPGLRAAEPSRWLARPPWQTDDGLPNNTVYGVAQTPDGFIWLGTPTGLARFDGARFQVFSSTNFVSPPNRGILTMINLRDGGLALTMDRGAVVLLRPDSARAFLPDRNLSDQTPYSMAEDAEGAVWVSYRDGAVCRVRQGKTIRFTEQEGLLAPVAISALAADRQGRIWFARGPHFGAFRDGRFQAVATIPSSPTRLAAAHGGGIWICSGTRLLKFDEDMGLKDLGEFSSTPSAGAPTALLEDEDGSVWIGTAYSGLYHFSGTNFEAVPISHKEVTSLAEDREGSLWVGTTGDGLYQVRPRTVELEGTEEGLPFDAVQSLCEDTNGVLWAATQNGALARRIGDRWQMFSPQPDWAAPATCVTADPSGAIWIGTRTFGLFCWKDNRLTDWGNTRDLAGITVHTLQVGRSGDLWIGEDTPNALQRLRAGQLTTLDVPADDLRVIRAMTEGLDGSIWVGTSRGLLLRIRDGHVANETIRTPGEPTPSIRCLYTSPDGTVWIGYANWGVGWIKNGRSANIRTEQGLYDDGISHIVADGHGWLWFGSDRGIFKVRQKELDDVAEGRANRVRSIHYGKGEGLASLQANFGGAPGALRSRDGRLWIPMRTALAVVNPDPLYMSSYPPPVLLCRVAVDDRTAAAYCDIMPTPDSRNRQVLDLRTSRGPLHLPPGHRRVQFDFTALSFTAPENVHFRYRLDGSDDDWGEDKTERTASYLRLPAGTYTFRVIACNSDDLWNETGASLQVIVAPFVWQTWWFKALLGTLFTLLVIAVVRYVSFRRLRFQLRHFEQQEALHRERARIAKDIHDDVGANLTQIALLGDLARQDVEAPDKLAARLAKVSDTARQAVKSLDEIVWAVNPRNDTLAHLVDYTGQFALDYLRVAGIRCRLDLPDQTPEREISTDVRHNLFLVVKEALNNIVKHARATEVWLRVSAAETGLRIAVEDNGCGFSGPPADAGADGLRNMRQRIQEIGGQCRIESQPGAGTKVLVELPWPPQVHA